MARLTLQRLLSAGYFPEVLPPPFSTESFGDAFATAKTPPPEFWNSGSSVVPRTSRCVRYHQSVAGGMHRTFSIPNPVHFFRLAECFYRHRKLVMRLAKVSPISLTKPVVSKGRQWLRPIVGFKERPAERARVRAGARYILRADISRFFPSIYTHSIAWAFHGKAYAKANRHNRALPGNQLDTQFQNLQDGQTMGIPIGQDISRVIAEVILGQIENDLNYKTWPDGMRCIDDFELGFLSRSRANAFRQRLERGLAEYELALNPLKTNILTLPQLFADRWDSELRRFDFGQGPLETKVTDEEQVSPLTDADLPDAFRTVQDGERLLTFLNTAIALQQEFPDEGVLRFALVRLAHLRISEENWDLVQNFVFQCALNQPETMRLVVSILLRAKFIDEQSVDSGRLGQILDAIIETSGPVPRSGNVAWAIWAALLFRCDLGRDAASHLAKTEDSVIACLACEANNRGLWPGTFALPAMKKLVRAANSLYDEHWLFAYESARNGWLGRSSHSLGADPCFRYLLSQDVAFFTPQTDRELKRHLRSAVKSKNLPPSESDSDDEYGAEDMFDLWWFRKDSD